jgi:hypothetical protein
MSLGSVYWIRSKDHTDPYIEGYIGVTNDFKRRFGEHQRRARGNRHVNPILAEIILGEDYEIDILHQAPLYECYLLEKSYRPQPNVGWNVRSGRKP